jgi:S-adenosylmethionine hydrolase
LIDPFVGIMKGVILQIAPDVRIVDITHAIDSYDIAGAAFVVNSFYRYFPPDTIHIVVVDPGVGSVRRAIATRTRNQYFIAPDNGVLSSVLQPEGNGSVPSVYTVTNDNLFVHPVSRTFHGRDIFAPTAAHLARGTRLEEVGDKIDDYIVKPLAEARAIGPSRLMGQVLGIDKFGNIITNLRLPSLPKDFMIRLGGAEVRRHCGNFAEAPPGELFAIEGSTGYIEIALNQGSAAARLNVAPGAEIEVESGFPTESGIDAANN